MMRCQLRDYVIADGRMEEFLDAWRNGVVPLRESFGFRILGSWRGEGVDRFVWVVGHEGDFETAEAEYYASPDREALDPDPRAFIVTADVRFMRPVSVSP